MLVSLCCEWNNLPSITKTDTLSNRVNYLVLVLFDVDVKSRFTIKTVYFCCKLKDRSSLI